MYWLLACVYVNHLTRHMSGLINVWSWTMFLLVSYHAAYAILNIKKRAWIEWSIILNIAILYVLLGFFKNQLINLFCHTWPDVSFFKEEGDATIEMYVFDHKACTPSACVKILEGLGAWSFKYTVTKLHIDIAFFLVGIIRPCCEIIISQRQGSAEGFLISFKYFF